MPIKYVYQTLTHASENIKCISTCVDQTHPKPAMPLVLQRVLDKLLKCQGGHNIHFIKCWPSKASEDTKCTSKSVAKKSYDESEDSKCVSKCVFQTHAIPANIQNSSQHVMIILIPCQRGYKMYLNMCWPNASNASKDKKCISKLLTKNFPCRQWHKKHLS